MDSFLANVAASLLAGLILLALTARLSRRVRWLLSAILARLVDIDVEIVFTNGKQAETEIEKELRKASYVKLLTGRGHGLQHDFLSPLLSQDRAAKTFQILLPDPDSPEGLRWIRKREEELATFDAAFGDDLLRRQIKSTTDFLERHRQNGRVALQFYTFPLLGRVILTDRCAFFSPYRSRSHARDSRVIKYRAGGEMHAWFLRLFDELWSAGSRAVATQISSIGAQQPPPTA